jgi:hypothetical protein
MHIVGASCMSFAGALLDNSGRTSDAMIAVDRCREQWPFRVIVQSRFQEVIRAHEVR